MRAEEIRDRETLEAWLRDQPREVAVMIAVRAASRAVPAFSGLFAQSSESEAVPALVLALFRSLLAASVSSVRTEVTASVLEAAVAADDTAPVRVSTTDAAFEAAAAASALVAGASERTHPEAASLARAAGHAARAARAAALAAGGGSRKTAFAASDAAWAAHRIDASFAAGSNSVNEIMNRRLWISDQPKPLASDWQELREALKADAPDWSFWIDWYECILNGAPQNWDMLTEIVLIPDADWQQGPRHVNALIAGIVAKHRGEGAGKRAEDLPQPAAARLQAQVAFLLRNPQTAKLSASALAAQINTAISVYLNAERLNQLPDELEVFQRVADTLSAMSDDLTGAEPDPDTVVALEQRIVDLEGQVTALIEQLRESKRPGRGAIFLDKFAEAAGTQAGRVAILGVIGGAGWFLGRYLPPGAWADLAQGALATIR